MILFLAQCAFSHTPTEWRQIFAEAQVPHAKIMGCAKFWCSAGSLAMVRDAAAMVRDV